MKRAIKGLEGASCAYSLLVCAILPGRGRVEVKCCSAGCKRPAILVFRLLKEECACVHLRSLLCSGLPEPPVSCVYWLGDC